MALQYFPASRPFWLLHVGAMALTGAITLLTAYLWNSLTPSYIAASLLWSLPYTVAVLGFRWLYQRRGGSALPMGTLILAIVVYGTLAGLLVAASVAAVITPCYWSELTATHGVDFDVGGYLRRKIISDGLQSQLFICAWAFIYVSVTGNRRIRETELSNLRLQASLKEAQLSSLSNQLNPHFLFNAINNIRFMIHEDANQADAMLVALAEVLRYSLDSSQHQSVPLSQELAIVDRYLTIAKAQLERRLDFSIEAAPALLNFGIPPMMLQMLVENAIKHGLEQLPAGGTLRLNVREDGAQLLVEVSNSCPAHPHAAVPSTGIGHANIRQRLALLYGDQATLTATRTDDAYRVLLTVPKEPV